MLRSANNGNYIVKESVNHSSEGIQRVFETYVEYDEIRCGNEESLKPMSRTLRLEDAVRDDA